MAVVVVVDTRIVPPSEREPMLVNAFSQAAPVRMKLDRCEDLVGSLRVWELPEISVIKYAANTGLSLVQKERPDEQRFAIAVQTGGRGTFSQFDIDHRPSVGQLFCVDRARPFDFGWIGSGETIAVHVSAEQLGLSEEAIQRALTRVQRSPLAGLLANHVGFLGDVTLSDPASASLAARNTVELFRALVLSVTTGEIPHWTRTRGRVSSRPVPQTHPAGG